MAVRPCWGCRLATWVPSLRCNWAVRQLLRKHNNTLGDRTFLWTDEVILWAAARRSALVRDLLARVFLVKESKAAGAPKPRLSTLELHNDCKRLSRKAIQGCSARCGPLRRSTRDFHHGKHRSPSAPYATQLTRSSFEMRSL